MNDRNKTSDPNISGLCYENEETAGYCEEHGAFSGRFERITYQASDRRAIRGLLAAACPSCGVDIVMPPQSLPSVQAVRAGFRPTGEVRIRTRTPMIARDALDLACWMVASDYAAAYRSSLLSQQANKLSKMTPGGAGNRIGSMLTLVQATVPERSLLHPALVSYSVKTETSEQIRTLAHTLQISIGKVITAMCFSALAESNVIWHKKMDSLING